MPQTFRPDSGFVRHVAIPEVDPAIGSIQLGYRKISCSMDDITMPLRVLAWAIGFDSPSAAAVRYADIKSLLDTVSGTGLIAVRVTGVVGDRFGSLSERTDLLGEHAVAWISAVDQNDEDRGSVLAAHNGALIQIMTVAPYSKSAALRAPYLLEAIAASMVSRSPEPFSTSEPDEALIMDRLPGVDDFPTEVPDVAIETETYRVNS